MAANAVQNSTELKRIKELPRRVWDKETAEDLAHRLTSVLRTGSGTWTLRPIQAVALAEIGKNRGAFLPIRVGGGKTLISLLAPQMVGAKRPLLLLPAHLRDKTKNEMDAMSRDWNIGWIRVESYQSLSRVGCATLLEDYSPDMIIADECHYLKNSSSACTKRVSRYIKKNYEDIVFVGMSGTITKRSIKDFAHLSNWALKSNNPCPEDWNVLDEWSRALDVNVAHHRRLLPGALAKLRTNPMQDIRKAYRDRLVQTPGVVATQDQPLDVPLTIESHVLDAPGSCMPHWRMLRDEYKTPDGWECADAVEVWRHAKELAIGCYYRWNPRPPPEWMDARSEWSSTCRDIIKTNRRHLDTELQVRNAIDDGTLTRGQQALRQWEKRQPQFQPNVEAVWVSDHAVDWILRWMEKGPGIVWVSHRFLGERLVEKGAQYFGSMGLDKQGASIEECPPGQRAIAASIAANGTGRNLQRWNRNLVVGVPPNGSIWEQLLGRTHRDGQKNPVHVDVLMGCLEDVKAFWRACEDSHYCEDMTGQAQKLNHADIESVIEPSQVSGASPQWSK